MIRFATEEDLPALVDLGRKYYKNVVYTEAFPFDEQTTINTFRSVINGDKNSAICLVLDDNGIKGVLLANSMNYLFAKGKIAVEILWLVEENYRGRGSLELHDAYVYWQKQIGCLGCTAGSAEGSTDLDRFYKKKNYKLSEKTYFRSN